jgi:Flp pilus assembly protein TadG
MSASRPGRGARQDGQTIVLFALSVVAIMAMAGILIDGGMAWAHQRQAQAAADTADLAAAEAASSGTTTQMNTAARDIAASNGFAKDLVDCAGTTQPNKGVVVNRPPASGPHSAANDPDNANDYVEVITTRAMHTTFAAALGQSCWLVSARAVASISSTGVASCNFCVLSDWLGYSTFLIDNGADLRVDGDIVVNQDNWYGGTEAVNRCGTNPCTPPSCSDWNGLPSDQRIRMCGDSAYIAHSGGATDTVVSANTISINGGWQAARYQDVMRADQLAAGCQYHPEPLAYAQLANVCIGMPKIVDPLNDPANPANIIDPPDPNELSVPVADANGCPAGADVPTGSLTNPAKLSISSGPPTSYHTICPGLYFGGFSAFGDTGQPKITMQPGIYFMVGGGFQVTGTASIDGSAGVMIYNSGGNESFSSSTLPGSGLVPPCDTGTSTCLNPIITGGGNGLSGTPGSTSVNTTVTYRMSLLKVTGQPKPTGTIDFYDGQDPIGCTVAYSGDANHLVATCATSYPLFGTRWITAVYSGDAVYAPIGDTFKETINPPSGEAVGVIDICTGPVCGANASCNLAPCSQVVLHAPASGPYAGLLLFQARQSGLGVRLWPYDGAPACTGSWMTDGVPPDANPVPPPCGPIGGLNGTVYAPHQSTGASDWDVVVNLRTGGLANLQIIAAQISLAYESNSRLAYDATQFANGRIRLVE